MKLLRLQKNFITSAACKRGERWSHRLKTNAVPATYRSGGHLLASLYINMRNRNKKTVAQYH